MATFRDIAKKLGADLEGTSEVLGVSAASHPRPHTLSFIREWSDSSERTVAAHPNTLFIAPDDAIGAANVIRVKNPRLAYALAVRDFLGQSEEHVIASTAMVDSGATVGERVSIGHFAVVEEGVVIGDDVVIDHHVVLHTGVTVGSRSRIGSHTSVGGTGFGFEMDNEGRPVRIGHMGGVRIGSDVEIGTHVSIAQGTIDPTVIHDHVKIDDCVFIAHNVEVGRSSFVIAGAEISGSVKIGERVWISPEATVINKVNIGDDALVGIGSVVVKDVESGVIVAGVPARVRGPRYA